MTPTIERKNGSPSTDEDRATALIFGDNRVNKIAIVARTGAYEGVTGSAVETSKAATSRRS